jgi:hypothetical protein
LEFSCIRTLCQSANLLSWRSKAHLFLLEHVALTHIIGCTQHKCRNQLNALGRKEYTVPKQQFKLTRTKIYDSVNRYTNLSIFELLFNIFNHCSTVQAFECS